MTAAVVFVTDFGVYDTYAGALVGAVWGVDAGLRCAAATHGVPAGDVLAGAYHLKAAARAFPPGSVLCGVVDPGVGSARRALAIEAGTIRCVLPDNGLASYLWAEAEPASRACVTLATPAGASATFQGRDLFAPAAARLASGAGLAELGEPAAAPLLLGAAFPEEVEAGLRGRVVVVDHFGNAITTVRESDLRGRAVRGARWESGATEGQAHSYAEIGDGLALVVGSCGHLEVAAQRRAAATLGGPTAGSLVEVLLD